MRSKWVAKQSEKLSEKTKRKEMKRKNISYKKYPVKTGHEREMMMK